VKLVGAPRGNQGLVKRLKDAERRGESDWLRRGIGGWGWEVDARG
jgi:hypothetical protein